MKNMKIGTRLLTGFGFLLALVLLLAGLSAWYISTTQQARDEVRVRQQMGALIDDWARQIEVNSNQALAFAMVSDPEVQEFYKNGMAESARKSAQGRKQLETLLSLPEELELYNKVLQHRANYTEKRDVAFKALETGASMVAYEFLRNEMPELIRTYIASADQLGAFQDQYIQDIDAQAQAKDTLSSRILLVATLLALILGPLFAYLVTRSITRPLRYAVGAAEAVAGRDLSHDIAHGSKDETGLLLQALSMMSHSLRDAMGEVRSGANSIATAAEQIAAGNVDLSSRTEEQASSLAQTAATMEELTATVRQNADNTHQANSLAAAAAKIAGEGGAVVAQVVDTMSEINSKSRQVADILSVIDTIAFQTNILALNAAVEAARAGEQGRGFAVVASEVRALAQRSATAAKEIKTLIDASVAATTTGNEQAALAGNTMEQVVAGINQVTAIMEEISAASREQTTGIEEINSAVMQMDDVTRQNASLVEESAAAAASLQSQAHTLERLVETFRLADDAQARPTGQATNILVQRSPVALISVS